MIDNKIVFGVAGAGFIGKRHLAMIDADEETLIGAVCDVRSPQDCGVAALPYGHVPFYSSVADMLAAHPEIDVVSVCTPNGLHASMASQVLADGRSVLMEKPMATSLADAQMLLNAAHDSRGRFFSVFQNRYTPTSVWAHDVVAGGLLGNVCQVVVNCMWNRDERYYKPGHWHGTAKFDAGTLYTQFSHFIDILLWLVGPITVTGASFADHAHHDSTDFEDTGVFSFTTQGGGLGTFNYTTAVAMQNLESSITIIGTRGSIKVGGQYMSEVSECNIKDYVMPTLPPANPPNDYGEYKGSAANHCYVIRNVADVLLHGAQPTADVHDGFAVVKTIADVYAMRPDSFRCSHPLVYKPC